jgi:hypothetical protein
MMSLLREHPAIVVPGDHPFEVAMLRHAMNCVRIMGQPPVLGPQLPPALEWLGQDPRRQGSLRRTPLETWMNREYVERLATSLRDNVTAFYEQAARCAGQIDAAYFAEKTGITPVSSLVLNLFPDGRLIFLIRDPRDLLCSITHFNARRGYLSFNRQSVATDEEYVPLLFKRLIGQHRLNAQCAGRVMAVRYEDLIRQPLPTLERIFNFFELETTPAMLREMLESGHASASKNPNHVTSKSTEESIGRWRRDLSPHLVRLVEEHASELLDAYGYRDEGRSLAA